MHFIFILHTELTDVYYGDHQIDIYDLYTHHVMVVISRHVDYFRRMVGVN